MSYTAIMVIVGRVSKATHLEVLLTHFSASKLAALFTKIVYKLHHFLGVSF